MEQGLNGVIDYIIEGAEEFGIPYTDLNSEYVEGEQCNSRPRVMYVATNEIIYLS